MARSAEPRRAVPMRLQRDKALELCADLMRKLGMVAVDAEVAFELDHDPALVLRPVDPETGQHIPHQHDPRHLVWMTKEAHDRKTNGRGGERRVTTLGSDKHLAAKLDRLSDGEREFRARLLSRDPDERQPSRRPGKPMGGTRNSHLKRRFDGKVVDRTTGEVLSRS